MPLSLRAGDGLGCPQGVEVALLAMVEGDQAAQPRAVGLRVSVREAADYARLSTLARSLGLG